MLNLPAMCFMQYGKMELSLNFQDHAARDLQKECGVSSLLPDEENQEDIGWTLFDFAAKLVFLCH